MKPKQLEQERPSVHSESEAYESILSALSAGVVRIDETGTISYSNDSAAHLLGCTKEDLVGSSFLTSFFGKDAQGSDPRLGPFQFTLAEREISHVNTENFVRCDGSKFLAEYICVPLESGGATGGAVVSFSDVTEQRNTEQAVSNARDIALEAARSKAEFLANMSHEIRTPLTGIIGIVELLSSAHSEVERSEFLRILKSSTEFLHSTVNDILDFSKIEAGKFKPNTTEFEIRKLVELAVDPFYASAAQKNLEISLEFKDDLDIAFLGDAKSIRQILNNLVSNAVKFTESGSVTISVSKEEAKETIEFHVSDTGSGIETEKSSELFAPFVQADASDSRSFEGTGLGLAISRRLVKLLGGEIGFTSKKGVGTDFWFKIPVKRVATSVVPETAEPVIQLDRNLRVLIVEDNPVTMRVTERMLRNCGINAAVAANGEEALRLCTENEFDVVLMDCQMPEMDGYETSARLRELVGNKLRIIAFTASVAEEEAQRQGDAGMNGVLHKPFTSNELVETISRHFGAAGGNEILDTSDGIIQDSLSKFIDRENLDRLISLESNDSRGFLSEILSVFVNHTETKLLEIEAALKGQDRKSLKQASHNLRGSSANLGVSRLSGMFERLESLSSSAEWHDLNGLFDDIKQEFAGLQRAMTDIT